MVWELPYVKISQLIILCTGLAVQCLSVGVGVKHASEVEMVEGVMANISKHGQDSLAKDVNEKQRRVRQAEGGGDRSSGDPLDWLRASVPGEPGQDYPILSAIQVIVVITIIITTIITIIKSFPGEDHQTPTLA